MQYTLARVTAGDGKAHLANNSDKTLCGKHVTGFDFGVLPLCQQCQHSTT